MIKYFLSLAAIVALSANIYSQQGSKSNPKKTGEKSQMEKMMEEAQKELDKLSPEQKAMFDEMMKNQVNKPGRGADNNHFVPKKQAALLSKIKKINTSGALNDYINSLLAEAQKNIPVTIISQVDILVMKYKNEKLALHNLPMVLFMQKQTAAAVYAGLVCARETKASGTVNNLGFLLTQAGYPQYAIPILEFLNQQYISAIALNNSGQAFLRLGDTSMAYKRFFAAIKLDDELAEAHSGIAHILLEQNRDKEATVHIAKTFRSGYDETLADHVTKNNIKLPFDYIKRKNKADYFSKQKYAPLEPALTLDTALSNWNKIEAMEQEATAWQTKSAQLSRELPVSDEKWQLRMVTKSVTGPYKRKARLMVNLMLNNFTEYLNSSQLANGSLSKIKEAESLMNQSIDKEYKNNSFGGRYEECLMIKKHIEKYLAATAPLQANMINRFNSKYFDLVNEELYWLTFFLNSNEYRAEYANIGRQVVEWQKSLSNVQHLYPHVINRGILCQDILNNPPEEEELEMADGKCPITLKIPIVIASLKFNCEGWEFEGGEGIIFNLEHRYERNDKSGQWTIAMGPGWDLDMETSENGVGAMLGGKIQAAFVFDEDFTPVDIVIRGEAKGELNTIMQQNELGVKGMISISGAASADALAGNVNNGNEINIFKYEPK